MSLSFMDTFSALVSAMPKYVKNIFLLKGTLKAAAAAVPKILRVRCFGINQSRLRFNENL